jgi:hypothetical protein
MLMIPVVEVLSAPLALAVVPADTLPITLTVPAPVCPTPVDPLAPPPVAFATSVHDWPAIRLEEKQLFEKLATTPDPVHVNVIPLVGTNCPPAVTPVVAALLMLSTVGLVSMVTVKVLL